MKKILFVIEDLKFGGVEVSLVNLLNSIDFEEHNYSVVLLMWGKHYEIMSKLKDNPRIKVKIIKTRFPDVVSSFAARVIGINKAERIKNILIRTLVIFAIKMQRADVVIRYHQNAIKSLFTHLGTKSKNITWYHSSNYNDYYLRKDYIEKCDKVVVVNEFCKKRMADSDPYLADKLFAVKNIIPYQEIREKAETDEQLFSDEYFNIVTCARLDSEKGIDIAVQACNLLKDKIPEMKWFIVGGIPDDRTEYANDVFEQIANNGLEDTFICIGAKSNPYPYFKQCDLYVQPSREESWGLTIAEAQVCGAAIVSTDTIGAKILIENERNGFVVDISAEALADKIYELYNDTERVQKIRKNLADVDFEELNRETLEDFYSLIES